RRWTLGFVGSAVVLGFGAASAWAAPASHLPHGATAARGFVGAAPTRATFDEPLASFGTDPVDVTIGSVVYQMTINVNQDLSSPGNQPALDVDFDRSGGGSLF